MIADTDLVQDKPLPPKPPSKKLTKAEKRAAKKLEEEERKKQLRRDHLQRELRISDYNWKTLKWKFMDMLREMKMPQMQEDALTVWRVFERTIDNKNFAISQLKDCLDEADLQYAINLNQHLEIIDNLIASFIDRMNDMKADFDAECLEITNEASGLRSSIISEQDTSDGQLRAIMIAMERHFETYMTSYVSESNAKVDDEKNKAIELLQNLSIALERHIEQMWYQLKAMLVDYVKCTTDIRKHYSFLKILDTNMSAKLHQQLDRNQELHDLIRRYKDRLARVRKHKITIIYDLKDQRQFYQDTFIKQRDRFNKEDAHDRSQLTLLTVESNACMKWLENLADKQERILKIAEICRKMETEQEKVCPFPDSITSQSIEDNKSAGSSDPLIQIFHDFQDLELFWLRVGEADKKRMEMTEYRDLLVLENHYLHHSLQHYLAGLPQLQVPSILQEYYARDKSLCRYKHG